MLFRICLLPLTARLQQNNGDYTPLPQTLVDRLLHAHSIPPPPHGAPSDRSTHTAPSKANTHNTPGSQNHPAEHYIPRAALSHTRISPDPPVPVPAPMQLTRSRSPLLDNLLQMRAPVPAVPVRAAPVQASSWISSRMLQCGSLPSRLTGQEMHETYPLLSDIGRGSSIRGHNKTVRVHLDPRRAPAAPHKYEGSGRCLTLFLSGV